MESIYAKGENAQAKEDETCKKGQPMVHKLVKMTAARAEHQ
jgi:hypothetical protein